MQGLSARLKTAIMAVALVAATIAPAYAMDVAFGYLRKDGTINQIMYYRDGTWVKPISSYYDIGNIKAINIVQPHDSIVNAWLQANHEGNEPDCKKLGKNVDQACIYIKKLGRPLKQVTAEELSTLLRTVPIKKNTYSAEELAKILSADTLTRMLDWRKVNYGEMDMPTYAKIFWGTQVSAFSQWYHIGKSEPLAIRILSGRFGPAEEGGDCNAESPDIKVEPVGNWPIKPGMVATQKWGFRWIPFETIANLDYDVDTGAAKPENNEPPAKISELVLKIKSKWNEAASKTVLPKVKIKPQYRESMKKRLSATTFHSFRIKQAISYQDKSVFIFFEAIKYYREPLKNFIAGSSHKDQTTDPTITINYRGWALIRLGGEAELLALRADLGPNNEDEYTRVEEYMSVRPYVLLELDGKQYVVTDSDIQQTEGTWARTEVFELLDGKFKSRGIYGGACRGAEN